MERNTKKRVAGICRTVFGLVFVFSGFVKTIDPWGTAIKIAEYLNTYGFATSSDWWVWPSVFVCAAELTLGLMMVFGVKVRLVSIAAVAVMVFFTILTFLSATWKPVADCGCFGDALKLPPWVSFGKNAVLLAMAVVVWLNVRKTQNILPISVKEWVATALFACIAVGLGAYCYYHLPLVDFLPYKKGVDLYAAIYDDDAAGEEVRLVYRDLADGSLHEFAVSDTTWYDTARWEFVEQARKDRDTADVSLREFAVFNSDGDTTHEIVGYPGRVYILSALKLDKIKPRCAEKFGKVVDRAAAEGSKVVLITSSPISDGETAEFGDAAPVMVYNADATTMITMLRASTGVVVLDGGVITDKRNCRDIR